jgi:serine/threonine-protein kinase
MPPSPSPHLKHQASTAVPSAPPAAFFLSNGQLEVLCVLLAILLFWVWRLKHRTERAAATVLRMTQEVLEISGIPIGRREVAGCVLESRVGESGGTIIYRAQDVKKQPCDVRVPTVAALADKNLIKRFEREAHVLEGVENPYIVRFRSFTHVKERGRSVPVLITEAVAGETLAVLMRRESPMAPQRVCTILSHIAGGLAAVHRHDIVHRNIQPSSITLDKNGQAVLHSFGIGLEAAEQNPYVAPELIEAKTPDARSDLYSLGVVAFEMLTGRLPSPTMTHASSLNPKVPAELDALISSLLSTEPGDRVASAGVLITELHQAGRSAYGPSSEERALLSEARPE